MKKKITSSLILSALIYPAICQTISFEEVTSASLEQIDRSRIAMADMDGDQDDDLILIGYDESNDQVALLYANDGIGGFSLVEQSVIEGASQGAVVFDDLDGDQDPDLIISGFTGSSGTSHKTQMYTNDGHGVFTKVENTIFEKMYNGDLALFDADGDTDLDLLEVGYKSFDEYIAKLYINDGTGSFSEKINQPFTPTTQGRVGIANIDGDTDLDILITGLNLAGNRVAELYTNDGSGNFTLVENTPFAPMYNSDVAFLDVDGDNDKDALLCGFTSSTLETILYLNDGTGTFTTSTASFAGVYKSRIVSGDIDQDQDLDLIYCGDIGSFSYRTYTYENDGSGNFSLVSELPFTGVQGGDLLLNDIDNDTDLDLVLSGNTLSGERTALYENMNTISAIFDESTESAFQLYPNPVENALHIHTEETWLGWDMYSLDGSLIRSSTEAAPSIDCADLAPGAYVIQLQTDRGLVQKQFFKHD